MIEDECNVIVAPAIPPREMRGGRYD